MISIPCIPFHSLVHYFTISTSLAAESLHILHPIACQEGLRHWIIQKIRQITSGDEGARSPARCSLTRQNPRHASQRKEIERESLPSQSQRNTTSTPPPTPRVHSKVRYLRHRHIIISCMAPCTSRETKNSGTDYPPNLLTYLP